MKVSAWEISNPAEVGNRLTLVEQPGYRTLGNEIDQLTRELCALSNRFSAFNEDGCDASVDLLTLTKLADNLDKANAKVKMAIRNLKIKRIAC
jgi:hypothetical protein